MPVLNKPHVQYSFEFLDVENNVRFRHSISCRDFYSLMCKVGFHSGDYGAIFNYDFQFTGLHFIRFWKNSSSMACGQIPESVGCDCVARDLNLFLSGVSGSTTTVLFNGLLDDHIEDNSLIVDVHTHEAVKCSFLYNPTSSCKRNVNFL